MKHHVYGTSIENWSGSNASNSNKTGRKSRHRLSPLYCPPSAIQRHVL